MPDVIYEQTTQSLWFWKLKGANGAVLAQSWKPYSDERGARRGFTNLLRAIRPMVATLREGR
jgi:hypothetical protein